MLAHDARAKSVLNNVEFSRTSDATCDDEHQSFRLLACLHPDLLVGLTSCGFVCPSPIQKRCLPLATTLSLDMVVQAKSGTGKTVVFCATLLHHILSSEIPASPVIFAIVICPTREIADQNRSTFDAILAGCSGKKASTIESFLLIGGRLRSSVQLNHLVTILRKNSSKRNIVIFGTPGRIIDILNRCNNLAKSSNKCESPVNLENLNAKRNLHAAFSAARMLILDEADFLLAQASMQRAINLIYSQLSIRRLSPADFNDGDLVASIAKQRQTLCLSATFPRKLLKHCLRYMAHPLHVKLTPSGLAGDTLLGVRQFCVVLPVGRGAGPQRCPDSSGNAGPVETFKAKLAAAQKLASALDFNRALVFTNNAPFGEQFAKRLCTAMKDENYAHWMSGKSSQKHRDATIQAMKTATSRSRVLVCSDVLSRGVDFRDVDLVIHLDLPVNLRQSAKRSNGDDDGDDDGDEARVSTYLHRVGRAGRFGSRGVSVILAVGSLDARCAENLRRRLAPNVLQPLPPLEALVTALSNSSHGNQANDESSLKHIVKTPLSELVSIDALNYSSKTFDQVDANFVGAKKKTRRVHAKNMNGVKPVTEGQSVNPTPDLLCGFQAYQKLDRPFHEVIKTTEVSEVDPLSKDLADVSLLDEDLNLEDLKDGLDGDDVSSENSDINDDDGAEIETSVADFALLNYPNIGWQNVERNEDGCEELEQVAIVFDVKAELSTTSKDDDDDDWETISTGMSSSDEEYQRKCLPSLPSHFTNFLL